MPDHIHCLFLLNLQKSIADVIKQIKGSSSHFVNESHLIPDEFSWQVGYAAYSVSESTADKVYKYIKTPKTHHKINTFQQEYEDLMRLYGFDKPQSFYALFVVPAILIGRGLNPGL